MKIVAFALLLLGLTFMGARSPRVKQGDTPPAQVLTTTKGEIIDLPTLRDKKVLLTFFRYAGCPICNFRVHQLSEAHDSLVKEGFVVIGVFESSKYMMKRYQEEYEVPFHIVSDPEGELYRSFAVRTSTLKTAKYTMKKKVRFFHKKGDNYYQGSTYKRDGKLLRSTADFIIENNVVTTAYYNRIIGEHLALTDL